MRAAFGVGHELPGPDEGSAHGAEVATRAGGGRGLPSRAPAAIAGAVKIGSVVEVTLGVAVRGEGRVKLDVRHVEAAAGASGTNAFLAVGARHRGGGDVVPHDRPYLWEKCFKHNIDEELKIFRN